MKRVVPLASCEPRALDEEVRVSFKHQSLLQDFLELQKVRVSFFSFVFWVYLYVFFLLFFFIEDLGFRISCLLINFFLFFI